MSVVFANSPIRVASNGGGVRVLAQPMPSVGGNCAPVQSGSEGQPVTSVTGSECCAPYTTSDSVERRAGAILGGHRAVRMSGANTVEYADNQMPAHRDAYAGVTTHAAVQGAMVTVQRLGELTETSWNWVAGLPIFVGTNGLLTQTPPTAPAVYSQIIGVATSPTSIQLWAREPITL